jgi:hypothetical protein
MNELPVSKKKGSTATAKMSTAAMARSLHLL